MATLTGNLIITLLVVILLADHSFALHCTQLVILPLKNSLCKVESVTTHLCVSLPVSPELYLCFSINICYSSRLFFLKIHSSVLMNKSLGFLTPSRLVVTANSPVSLRCKIVRRWPKQECGGGTWAKDLVFKVGPFSFSMVVLIYTRMRRCHWATVGCWRNWKKKPLFQEATWVTGMQGVSNLGNGLGSKILPLHTWRQCSFNCPCKLLISVCCWI